MPTANPMHVVFASDDPLMPLLEQRAVQRGFSPPLRTQADRKKLRRRLPKLVRELVRERLSDLATQGDPMAPAGVGSN